MKQIVFYWLMLLPLISQGQIYPYQNYSVKEGLIHSNVYGIAQDSIGYIWFATETGLSCFDGITFENYPTSKLGVESYISSVYTHTTGDLYFGCGINAIYKFEPLSKQLTKVNKSYVSQSNQLIIKDDILISLHEYHNLDIIRLSDGSFFSSDSAILKNVESKILCMRMLHDQRILVGRTDGLYEFDNGSQHKINLIGFENKPVYSIFENNDNSLYVGSDGAILKIVNSAIVDSMKVVTGEELRVRNILTDDKGAIWFNIWGTKDIFMISDHVIINVSDKLTLKNASVSEMYKDRNGNIWAGMLGKGFFLFSNMFLQNYPTSDALPASNIKKIIATPKGPLLLGTNDGLAILNPATKTISSVKHMPEMTQFVRDILHNGNNNYVVAITDIRLKQPFRDDFYMPGEDIHVRYSHGSSLWSDSTAVWVGNWDNSILKYQLSDYHVKENFDSVFKTRPIKLRINCITEDEFSRKWIGSTHGFCILNGNGIELRFPYADEQNEIASIQKLSGSQILVVSNTGISIYQNNPDVTLIKQLSTIKLENTSCCAIVKANEYLVGTKNGLYYIQANKKYLLTIEDGLLSDNINEIYFDKSKNIAYIASAEGVMELNLDKLNEKFKAIYSIDDVIIQLGDSALRPNSNLTFSHNQNSFTLKFHSLNFSNSGKINYQYKLDNGNWITSPSREVQFASLSPGSHTIALRAGEFQNIWGPVYSLPLTIEPPFYRTYLFYLLSAASGMTLLFLFIRRQLNKIKLKEEEKSLTQQKLVELQQKALASNLNPHFIFNSLNSIQHFINSHNAADANDYLSKFSRLMRMQLNMADKSFITLHEELTRLEFYLSLEQMRFGDKLKWEISVDPSIDSYSLEIPNMIIQPFIENAIWHGIMPSSIPGYISLNLKIKENNQLEIAVVDNGVGYAQNKINSNPNHQSKGVKLITERLHLLDPEVINLLTFDENNPGTRVTILLTPKMYRHSQSQKTTR